MRGREPGDLHVEFPFILREDAFQNACRDRPRDFATVPEAPCTITATTYFGWSYGAKQANQATFSSWPRSVACAVPVFPATTTSFKRARPPVPPSSLTTFQKPLRTSSISSGETSLPQIGPDARRWRHCRLALFVEHRRAVLVQDFIDQARIITCAAICDRHVGHRQLQAAKPACSPGRLRRWPFAPVTIVPADDGSASTPAQACCRFVHRTIAGPIPRRCQASFPTTSID